MSKSAFRALAVAVICFLANSNVDAAGAACCKAFAFDTNNLLRTSEASLDVAELNFRQLRQVFALLDDVKTLRIQQLHAFEAWRKLCTEQVLGRTGEPGSPGEPGEKGNKGAQGKWGEDGPPGDIGKPGVHGAPGFEGVRGSFGPTGLTGPPGQPGPIIKIKGVAGEMGPPGPPSRKRGPPGPKGYEGPRGRHGDRGEFGPIGAPSFCCQGPSHSQTEEHDDAQRSGDQDDHKKHGKSHHDQNQDAKVSEEHKASREGQKDRLGSRSDDGWNDRKKRERSKDASNGHLPDADDKAKDSDEWPEKYSVKDSSDGAEDDWDDDHHQNGSHENVQGWNEDDDAAHDDVNSDEKSAENSSTTSPPRTNGSNVRRSDEEGGSLPDNARGSLSGRARGSDDDSRRSRQ